MKFSHQSAPIVATLFSVAIAGCAGKKAEPAPVPQDSTPVASVAPAPATAMGAPAGQTIQAPGGGPSIVLPKPGKVRVDQHLITRDVLLATQYNNLYDVIQSLRSNWLRVRAQDSFTAKSSVMQVYLDTQRLTGGLDELKQMSPTNIESVRYYDAVEASARWGLDHGAGAIYILTAKR